VEDAEEDYLTEQLYGAAKQPPKPAPRPLDPEKAPEAFWKQVEEEAYERDLRLKPLRTLAAWRFTREVLRIRGQFHEEPLAILAESSYVSDLWCDPKPPIALPRAHKHRRDSALLEELAKEDLPLHPHNLEPEASEPFRRAFRAAMDYLQPKNEGLEGLLDPVSMPAYYPSAQELIDFEEEITSEALKKFIEEGEQGALGHLRVRYGLSAAEGTLLVRLAKLKARERLQSDPEEDKAVMILRLEDFIRRQKGSGKLGLTDPRLEMHALKQLAIVMGFGRMDPEDFGTEFLKIARKVHAEEPPRSLDAKSDFKLLPG